MKHTQITIHGFAQVVQNKADRYGNTYTKATITINGEFEELKETHGNAETYLHYLKKELEEKHQKKVHFINSLMYTREDIQDGDLNIVVSIVNLSKAFKYY